MVMNKWKQALRGHPIYLFILSARTENKLDYVFLSAVLDQQLQKISSKETYGGTLITTLFPRSKTHA